jgi:hypothetical protein
VSFLKKAGQQASVIICCTFKERRFETAVLVFVGDFKSPLPGG